LRKIAFVAQATSGQGHFCGQQEFDSTAVNAQLIGLIATLHSPCNCWQGLAFV
jgi:hypothetical protein